MRLQHGIGPQLWPAASESSGDWREELYRAGCSWGVTGTADRSEDRHEGGAALLSGRKLHLQSGANFRAYRCVRGVHRYGLDGDSEAASESRLPSSIEYGSKFVS